jgi:hypothetical protein
MGKKNLADPKRRQGQAQNVQATQYDDDDGGRGSVPPRGPLPPRAGGTPSRGRPPSRMRCEDRTSSPSPRLNSYASRRPPPPQHFAEGTLSRGQPPSRMRSEYCTPSLSRGPPTRGRPPSHKRSEDRAQSSSSRPRTTYQNQSRGTRPQYRSDSNATPPRRRSFSPPRRKRVFTEEEKAACPFSDTRWPPKGEYLRPLHFRYEVNGTKKRVYYNMIYQNTAFEVTGWLLDIEATAAEATSNIPTGEAPQINIMNALNSKKLRVISEGKRGKIWILD